MAKAIRSLQIRHVDAGSCNGCEQELTALTGRDYDIQRHGIDIVASPRHADSLIVTGPVTDTMALPLERVWETIPRPRVRIAFGNCAIGTGVFQRAYASHGGLADSDIEIPGCPPHPETALRLLSEWMTSHQRNRQTYVSKVTNLGNC